MNLNLVMNNIILNKRMVNMNQIYMQISQLMAQAMLNINQIMANMNQLMTNMNQMNQLINSVNGVQPNIELNNMNNMINNMNNIYEEHPNTCIKFRSELTSELFPINCNTKNKLKDIIQKYRIKSEDKISDRFIFNGTVLDPEKTIEESGIPNLGIIQCIGVNVIG